jgi:uncharacterized membrane protein YfcA
VKSPSLAQKRVLAGVYLVALILSAANFYLGWHVFGGFDKGVLAVVMLIGTICAHRFGPALVQELREYRLSK